MPVLTRLAPLDVLDIAATLDWYTAIGFKETGRWEDDGVVSWGMLLFGKAELALGLGGKSKPQDVSFWFYTHAVDRLYQTLKSHQLTVAQATLAGKPANQEIEFVEDIFVEDIYDPFYGGRQFSIRDLNGYS